MRLINGLPAFNGVAVVASAALVASTVFSGTITGSSVLIGAGIISSTALGASTTFSVNNPLIISTNSSSFLAMLLAPALTTAQIISLSLDAASTVSASLLPERRAFTTNV